MTQRKQKWHEIDVSLRFWGSFLAQNKLENHKSKGFPLYFEAENASKQSIMLQVKGISCRI